MGVTSEVEIVNGALIKLGAQTILSLDEQTSRGILCKAAYPKMRDLLLRGHPWHFNKGYTSLAQIDPKPSDVFDYDYVYQLPSDCVRVFDVDCPEIKWEELENGTLGSDATTIKIKYGKKITDVTKFDSAFIEALEWAIAHHVAYSITQSGERQDYCRKMLDGELAKARSFSAQVATPQQVTAKSWLYARRGWR